MNSTATQTSSVTIASVVTAPGNLKPPFLPSAASTSAIRSSAPAPVPSLRVVRVLFAAAVAVALRIRAVVQHLHHARARLDHRVALQGGDLAADLGLVLAHHFAERIALHRHHLP